MEQKPQKIPKRLPRTFFTKDVVTLSKDLLNTVLVRKTPQGICKALIVETEAYKGPDDKACHAYNNKKTEKTKYFWQDGGHLYVFSIYGSNFCLNITAATKDDPEAVLIRALEPLSGLETMKEFRKLPLKSKAKDLSNGPSKLTKAMSINKSFNAVDLTESDEIWLEPRTKEPRIVESKRINIDYAQEWVDKKWRFYVEGSDYVSVIDKK